MAYFHVCVLPHRGQPDTVFGDRMTRIKIVAAAFLGALVALFVMQNTELVTIEALVWSLEIRRAFLVLGILGIGVAIGWLLKSLGHR